MKKLFKITDSLYAYSQALDTLPPRGDGAKIAVATEVHNEVIKLLNYLFKHPAMSEDATYVLIELVEQMLLDKIDPSLIVKEMLLREEVN